MKRRGFTLIEILVVLGILSVIAGILLAVLPKAREKGRQSSCLSNLHQHGVALRLYVTDFDGQWPDMRAWTDTKINISPLLKCPNVTVPAQFAHIASLSYGYNFNLAASIPESQGISDSKIQWPSATISIAEVDITERPAPELIGFNYFRAIEDNSRNRPFERHSGGANYLFCDGHMKWYRPEQISQNFDLTLADGKMPSFAPY
jgi:prepilin-type N-terminal cleavage/methylation domain-containing protein/prepilin-type processing-associated H-X9-DG protein